MLLRTYTKKFSECDKNGKLITWPGLNNKQLLNNLPPRISTTLRNLDQDRKNPHSTKEVKSELGIEEDKYFYPDIETVNTHEVCATIIPFNINRKVFIVLTGTFHIIQAD